MTRARLMAKKDIKFFDKNILIGSGTARVKYWVI